VVDWGQLGVTSRNLNFCTLSPSRWAAEFGLPDVKPVQAAVMAKMEKRLTDAIDSFGPETIIQSWFSTIPQGADAMRNLLTGFLNLAASKKGGSE
jgi:Family of unknown function (DUF6489)